VSAAKNWSRENLAWAGGLFEGEGCISCTKGNLIALTVGSTDEDVLRRFAEIIGIGSVRGPCAPKSNLGKKPYWVWQANGFAKGQAVIAALWPFLGERRKARASELIRKGSEWLPYKSRRQCPQGHSYSPENTYVNKTGNRFCRTCARQRGLRIYYKKKALKNGPEQLHHAPSGG
jgi:hypothetical protein